MLLYHLMTDEGTLPDKVIPQVPQNLMQGEDQSVPRICVGQSLDDCLTGITVTGINGLYRKRERNRSWQTRNAMAENRAAEAGATHSLVV